MFIVCRRHSSLEESEIYMLKWNQMVAMLVVAVALVLVGGNFLSTNIISTAYADGGAD